MIALRSMTSNALTAALLILPFLWATPAKCQVEFKSVADAEQISLDPSIVNGTKPANLADYPATFYAQLAAGINCTASLIGPKVILTAAHCVANQQRVSVMVFDVENSKLGVIFTCYQNPGYSYDKSQDLALCLTESSVDNILYERVDLDKASTSRGAAVVISGFGCSTAVGNGSGSFLTGRSKIETANRINNFLEIKGDASLCRGDSGGAVYKSIDVENTRRAIVAINSLFNEDPKTHLISNTSYIAALTNDTSNSFLLSWMHSYEVQICGLTSGMQSCRPI